MEQEQIEKGLKFSKSVSILALLLSLAAIGALIIKK